MQISRSVNVPSSTVSDYCKSFEITTCSIDEFLSMGEDAIYEILFPEKNLPRISKDRPLPDVEYIRKEIAKKGVTFKLLWQEYKEMHPNGYGCSQFKSGYTFVRATPSQKQEDFILSHVLVYVFFGGVPNINVPDNLKSAIISNNKNGIVINESYAELARHYNCAIEPARPRKPQDKGMVEQGVQAILRWILAVFTTSICWPSNAEGLSIYALTLSLRQH